MIPNSDPCDEFLPIPLTVLQIRGSNRDNLRIIFHITPLECML